MNTKRSFVAVLLSVVLFGSNPALHAAVKLPAILGNHMVLQQNSDVTLWGWAKPGENVRVEASWQPSSGKSTKADKDGKWKVSIKTPGAGGPYTIFIKGNNTIKLEDILIGEVWVGSGQSNMEMPLVAVSNSYTGIKDFEKEVADANYPNIRLFQVGNYCSKEPLDDVQQGIKMNGIPPAPCKWQACTPETIPTFSSTSYFFARQLHRKLGVPIGIIDSSWGGTPAEAWTSREALDDFEVFRSTLEMLDKLKEDQFAAIKKFKNGKQPKHQPTVLYNAMIAPLPPFRIAGVIWYQGEANTYEPIQYRTLFPAMIRDWRNRWDQGDFPFYFVQIAPYRYDANRRSQALREAQLMSLSVPNTGMAVTMDIGTKENIHPGNKHDVGDRLARWALAKTYGKKDIVYSGPIYKSMTIENGKIRLAFDYTDGGLVAKDGTLSDFEIAGEDKKFVPAIAVIDGDTIVVSSDEVKNPVAVRYGWSNWVDGSLFNSAGLPASSFRTDDWPLE